jgi:hypothetical protein
MMVHIAWNEAEVKRRLAASESLSLYFQWPADLKSAPQNAADVWGRTLVSRI